MGPTTPSRYPLQTRPSLFTLQRLHGPGSPPDSFVGLLNSFVPLPDRGAGDLDRGLQGLGGLLGYEAGSAPGGSLDDARKQGGSLGLSVRPDGQDHRWERKGLSGEAGPANR